MTALLAVAAALALWFGGALAPRLFPPHSGNPMQSAIAERLAVHVFARPRPAPAFTFRDGNGRPVTLADFRGRVVLLNLWATWCSPCRREMPTLDRLEARLGGKDFLVLPVSLDRQGAKVVAQFYQKRTLAHLGIYLDPNGAAPTLFAAPGLPTSVLFDRAGREVARKVGPADWDGTKMVALIRRFLTPIAADLDRPRRGAGR